MRLINLIVGLLLLTACARPLATPKLLPTATPTSAPTSKATSTAGTQPHTVTDDKGRTVAVPASPQRIVSIGPEITEALLALGVSRNIIAVDDFSSLPAGAAVSRVGEPYPLTDAIPPTVGIDVDAVVALRPDLVIADARAWPRGEFRTACPFPALERAGILTVCVDPAVAAAGVTGALNKIRLLGQLVAGQGKAGELLDGYEQRRNAVVEKVHRLPKVRVLLVSFGSGLPPGPRDPGVPLTEGYPLNEFIELAGGVNVFTASPGDKEAAGEVPRSGSIEAYVARNPDVVLVSRDHLGQAARPGWEEIEAVGKGRVYVFGGGTLVTVIDQLERLARLLHPEAFGGAPETQPLRYRLTLGISASFGSPPSSAVRVSPPPGPDGRYAAGTVVTVEAGNSFGPETCSGGYMMRMSYMFIGFEVSNGTSQRGGTPLQLVMGSDKRVVAGYFGEFLGAGGPCAPDPLVKAAQEDLAKRLSVPVTAVSLKSGEPVRWQDTSLGCPRPGVGYAQVVTLGYRIILTSGGEEYRYHSDEKGPPFLCANSAPIPTPILTPTPTPTVSPLASCPGLELEGRVIRQAVHGVVQFQCHSEMVSVSFSSAAGHSRSVSIRRYATEQEARLALSAPNTTFRDSPAVRTTRTGYPGRDSLEETLVWQKSRWVFTAGSFDDTIYRLGPSVLQLSDDLYDAALSSGMFG